MRQKIWSALPLIGALAIASQAQAYTFTLSGEGMSASGTFTVGPDLHAGSAFGGAPTPSGPGFVGLADPTNALAITGASGTFTTLNIGISGVPITGVVANNYLPHFAPDPTIPYSFSWWTGAGFPGAYAATLLS